MKDNKEYKVDDIITGSFVLKERKFGFISTPDSDKVFFVAPMNVNGAWSGDIVEAVLIKDERKPEELAAKITKIINRNVRLIAGIVKKDKDGNKIFEADDAKIPLPLIVKGIEKIREKNKIIVRPVSFNNENITCDIIRDLGNVNDPGVDIFSVVYASDIPTDFSDETINYAKNLKYNVADEQDRVDLTDKLLVTIDGKDAKDLDDSIYIEKQGEKYLLNVSIADVSHYVKEGTAIDSDALTRGTSVYIPGSVVPMLPHELSDDLCSLNPNTKKLTMTAEIIVDENGKMESYKIYKSFIYSHHRLNYDEVNELFEGNIQELYTPELTKMLNVARELYEKVRIDKEKNGMISFEAAESKVILDQTGRTIDVVNRVRKDAEKMIEQFMVLANEATATFLSKSKFNSIYRIHDEPSAKKIKNYNQIIEIIGENKKERNHIPQKDITLLCDKIHNRPNYNIFANLILRCMEKARYDIQNIGHYGLSSKNYTHFTSPIRRYPDLIVHRLLKYALTKKETGIFANDRDLMLSICEQCNKTETRAMECEWKTKEIKISEYMNKFKHQSCKGFISTITAFGFFVEINGIAQGLISLKNMHDDKYIFNEAKMELTGEEHGKVLKIGDEVEVSILQIIKQQGRIDLVLTEQLELHNKMTNNKNNRFNRDNNNDFKRRDRNRGPRQYRDRNDYPRKSFGDNLDSTNNFSNNGEQNLENKREFGDRPERSFDRDKKPFGDRPRRNFGERREF
ncbi:MAG: ribonuclease R, partial [Mycoplasma sp.]